MKKILFAVPVFISLLSCKKEATNNNNTVPARFKVFLNTSRFIINTPTASTRFEEGIRANGIEGSNVVDLGIVKYGDSILMKLPPPSINYYKSGYVNPNINTGWSSFLDGNVVWSVSGNTSSGIPSFSDTTHTTYPSLINKRFPTAITIDRNSAYTVSWDNSVPADSLDVWLSAGNIIVKSPYLTGNINSYTFTPTQLQTLPISSSGLLQISGYIQKNKKIGDVEVSVRNIVNSQIRNVVLQ